MGGLIVHEWISKHGGSENVAERMASAFPDSDVLCLWNDAPQRFGARKVKESWLARTPLRKSKVAALPFMPVTWSAVDVGNYDFVLASSHLFAHMVGGEVTEHGPQKYVYVHTPARYLWAPDLDPRGRALGVKLIAPIFRHIDAKHARSGAHFAANSHFVRRRICESWDQDARVIYPPVDISRIQSASDWTSRVAGDEQSVVANLPPAFILGASRFVPYKRLDLVIRAGESLGLPVVLAGSGPSRDSIAEAASLAKVPVSIVDKPSDALLYALYQQASVFVFPAIEDFGIMPVEAMSLGTPVAVARLGGARESVELLCGGTVFDPTDLSDIARAVTQAIDMDMAKSLSDAERIFGSWRFESELKGWLSESNAGVGKN